MLAKKASRPTQAFAWRLNKTYNWLKNGKTRKWIENRPGHSKASKADDFQALMRAFKGKPPMFIPPKGVGEWSLARAKKVAGFVESAKRIIEGETGLAPKKPIPLSKTAKRVIAALKRNPDQGDLGLSKLLKVTKKTVHRYRKRLEDKGEIPRLNKSEFWKLVSRDPKRKTGYFTEKQRQKILRDYRPQIEITANWAYRKAKDAFDKTNWVPEKIADEIAERLDWKLQTYNPSKLKGPEETKLARYLNYQRPHIAYDLKRLALRTYRKIESLESEAPGNGSKSTTYRQTVKAKPVPFEVTVETLEKISTALKLNQIEKAVLYGLAIKMAHPEIGKIIGYRKSNITRIKKNLLKRVQTLQKREEI